jgi:flagellar biosynthesis regulator FlbT
MILLQCTYAYLIKDMFHESLPVFINTFVTQTVIKSLKISEATHLEETKF